MCLCLWSQDFLSLKYPFLHLLYQISTHFSRPKSKDNSFVKPSLISLGRTNLTFLHTFKSLYLVLVNLPNMHFILPVLSTLTCLSLPLDCEQLMIWEQMLIHLCSWYGISRSPWLFVQSGHHPILLLGEKLNSLFFSPPMKHALKWSHRVLPRHSPLWASI